MIRQDTLDSVIGQRRILAHLRRLVRGAQHLGQTSPSLLFAGPSGCGKTTMARAVAHEYGSELHLLFAGNDTSARDICQILFLLKFGDVLFLDEIHSLNSDAQQVLYTAMDEHKAPLVGERRLQRSRMGSIAQFTLVAATNEPGGLKRALRTRLTPIQFEPYTIEELQCIGQRAAEVQGLRLAEQATLALGRAACGNPRRIVRWIRQLQLYYPDQNTLTADQVQGFLESEGVDPLGFSVFQRLYLRTLLEHGEAGCSLKRLSVHLGCDARHLQEDVEAALFSRGLIEVAGGRGRLLTGRGQHVAAELLSLQRLSRS